MESSPATSGQGERNKRKENGKKNDCGGVNDDSTMITESRVNVSVKAGREEMAANVGIDRMKASLKQVYVMCVPAE